MEQVLARPSSICSGVQLLATLGAFTEASLQRETPLFAAVTSVAEARGGECTHAFLRQLPDDWMHAHLVIDSMLVWLQEGSSLPTQWYHHEIFPGRNERAFGVANAEHDVEHIACAFGAPSTREFLAGDAEASAARHEVDPYCVDGDDIARRHRALRSELAAGRLQSIGVPIGRCHRYDGRSFQRTMPASTAGFHFYIRATRGSSRPLVNGLRNVVSPSFTGQWHEEVTR